MAEFLQTVFRKAFGRGLTGTIAAVRRVSYALNICICGFRFMISGYAAVAFGPAAGGFDARLPLSLPIQRRVYKQSK